MAGRHIGHDELDAIAQGRVWTGEDALKIGLVDVLGGMDDAVKIAAWKAKLEKYNIVEYPVEKSPFEELFNELTGGVKMRMMQDEMGTFYDTWSRIKNIVNTQGLMARIPYDLIPN